MHAFACLLRGINVGRGNLVGMPALSELCEKLGLTQVRTILRSGNVVFRSKNGDRAEIKKLLQEALGKRFGITPGVFLRSREDLDAAIAANPFETAARDDPGHLLLMFFDAQPSPEGMKVLAAWDKGRERAELAGKNLYLHYPDGVGTSRLTFAFIEKAVKAAGTTRNWNTVLKLQRALRE